MDVQATPVSLLTPQPLVNTGVYTWVGKHYLFSLDRVGRFLGSEPRRALAEGLIMGGDLKQFSGVWDPWEERRTSTVLKQGWQKRPDEMWGMCRVVTIPWLRTPRCSDPSLTQSSLCALDMCVFPFYVCVCNNCDKVNVHRKGQWVIHESRLWVLQHYDQFKLTSLLSSRRFRNLA